MKKISLITTIILLIFGMVTTTWADNNGVWHNVEDIRGGTFGSDENVNTYYKFVNDLAIENASLNISTWTTDGLVISSHAPGKAAIKGVASNGAYSGYFEGGELRATNTGNAFTAISTNGNAVTGQASTAGRNAIRGVASGGAYSGYFEGGNLILRNNNLGIGTTSPVHDIDIRDSGTPTINLQTTGNANPGIELRSNGGGTPHIDFSDDGTADYDGRIILEGGNLKLESPFGMTFQGNSGMPWASFGFGDEYMSNAILLTTDFGEGQIYLSGDNSKYISLKGGMEQDNTITGGITIGGVYQGQYNTGANTLNPNANMARVHVKGYTYDYDILPWRSCQNGWVSVGNVWGGSAEDCRQVAGLIVEHGRVGFGTTLPAHKLHVIGNIYASGTVTQGSDIRFKKNINPIENGLSKAMEIRGVTYKLKNESESSETQIGVIAQELEKVMPELVITDEYGYKSVDYSKLSVIAIEAIKEQQKQIEKQQAEIDELKELLNK